MSAEHYLGAALTLLLISALGIYSGSRVQSSKDFIAGGRKAGPGIVAGAVMGTLAGGSATIGTAQLAFTHGFSAWWFTLGGALGCLVMAGGYAEHLYARKVSTMPQVLAGEYGQKTATLASILSSLGNVFGIVAQILSSVALITSVSSLSVPSAIAVSALLMISYVFFGGIWGAGLVGLGKCVLLLCMTFVCGGLALYRQGGWASFAMHLPGEQFFSLLGRGVAVDAGGGLALILGVLSSQAYVQAVISARSVRAARQGLLISAVLMPLIGTAGIIVGLYMRLHRPEINSYSALPAFILEFIPPLPAGMMLGVLLITVMGTAAGMALGVGAMFCTDIYRAHLNPAAGDKTLLRVSRAALICVICLGALIGMGNTDSLIIGWSFLSMGIRGAVGFSVLSAAMFLPGKISAVWAVRSMLSGLVCLLLTRWLAGNLVDPLLPGFVGSALPLIMGYNRSKCGV